MHVTRKNTSDTEVSLTISAHEADLSPLKQRTLKKLAPQVKVAGFREGKVPLNLVEKNLDQNVIQSEFLQEALTKLYNEALNRENLRPVSDPKVELKKFVPFTEIEFVAGVSVIGQIKLTDYTKIKLPKPAVKISDKDIEEVVKSLQKRAAIRKSVDRPSKDGDELIIDFKGTDDKGAVVNGAEGKDYPLVLGSKAFIPGFEEHLIGLSAGESKTFTITFPKSYGVSALQGKKVTFDVTAHKVQELTEPAVDDKFAATVGPFKTLKDLREDIKRQLVLEREQEATRAYEEELLQAIAAKSSVKIPKVMEDQQIERIEQEERQNLIYRGQTWEEHLKTEGVTADQHKEQKREAAQQRVKIGILLSEIAEKEKIVVSPQEFEVRLQLMKGQYKDATAQAELDKPEVQQNILARMMTEKTIEKLKQYASG